MFLLDNVECSILSWPCARLMFIESPSIILKLSTSLCRHRFKRRETFNKYSFGDGFGKWFSRENFNFPKLKAESFDQKLNKLSKSFKHLTPLFTCLRLWDFECVRDIFVQEKVANTKTSCNAMALYRSSEVTAVATSSWQHCSTSTSCLFDVLLEILDWTFWGDRDEGVLRAVMPV